MMNKWFVLICIVLLTACRTEEGDDGLYKKISAEEAKSMMDRGEGRIIDVREPSEYAGGHVPGAELLPLGNIKAGEPESLQDKEEVLLLYCRSGNRSAQAARKLIEYGYTNVYDFGGIIDWPYEVVK